MCTCILLCTYLNPQKYKKTTTFGISVRLGHLVHIKTKLNRSQQNRTASLCFFHGSLLMCQMSTGMASQVSYSLIFLEIEHIELSGILTQALLLHLPNHFCKSRNEWHQDNLFWRHPTCKILSWDTIKDDFQMPLYRQKSGFAYFCGFLRTFAGFLCAFAHTKKNT